MTREKLKRALRSNALAIAEQIDVGAEWTISARPIGAGSCRDLNDLLLFSCLTACVTGIVIAAASLL